jgi:hypothetical protein
MLFKAVNYSMGNAVKTAKFEARSFEEARREAERLVPGANALPGSAPMAAAKAQVIGIKVIG